MNSDTIKERIDAASPNLYLRTKAAIWEYLVDKHKGDTTAAASEAARVISGESKGKAYANARRNFEGSRRGQAGDTPKWRALGEKFPPIGKQPAKGYRVTGSVRVKISACGPNDPWLYRDLGAGWKIQKPTHFFFDPTEFDIINAYFEGETEEICEYEVLSLKVTAIAA